jgi:CheY-like chemotaxis protein
MARVLVVDDEPEVRKLARRMLEAAKIECADSDGAEALRLLQSEQFDVVLLDLFMPEVDGMEILQELHGKSSSVKIVAMSGGSSRAIDLLPLAQKLGAKELLRKPFDHATLLGAITRALT